MKSIPKQSANNRLWFWGIRITLCVAVFGLYTILLRPARIALTEHVVYPQVKPLQQVESTWDAQLQAGSLKIDYEYGAGAKQLSYRPEFGFFFLVAVMALLFVTNQKKHYLILAGLHLAASLAAYLFLLGGALGFQTGFVLVDAIGGYLTPALSLALVPLIVRNKI